MTAGEPAGPDGPVWRAIATRRAIRDFADRALEPWIVERIVDAGRRAASSKNSQRWDFVVVTDQGTLRELAAVGPWAGHLAGAAAAVALVVPDPRAPGAPLSILFDLGQAAANMGLAAWELGVGSVPATVYEPELARRLLGYPETHHCEYLLSFGWPADPGALSAAARSGGRRPLGDVLHRERWGNRG